MYMVRCPQARISTLTVDPSGWVSICLGSRYGRTKIVKSSLARDVQLETTGRDLGVSNNLMFHTLGR